MTRLRLRAAAAAAALSSVFLLASCQQFFTTSIATALARDSYDLSGMSVADAVGMLDSALAEGDAQVAAALVSPLFLAAEAAAPGTAAYDEAAGALVSAVVLSSGVGTAITTAVSELLPSFVEGGPDIDGSLIAEALDAFSAVSLTATERDALLMVAADPPEGMSANDAYSSAVALVADAFVDAGVEFAELEAFDLGSLPADVDTGSVDAALALLTYAQGLPVEEGSNGLFAGLISGFGFVAP